MASTGRPAGAEKPTGVMIAGRELMVSHPDKLLIPQARVRKIDLVNYYVSVAEAALRGAGGRPCVMVRYPDGIEHDFFFQKRAPAQRPEGLEIARLRFPSGREAEEVVPRQPFDLAWMAQLGCLELHPHPVRSDDLDHPDELRVDLDPVPGVEWPQIRQVAEVAREALADLGLTGWPKTSGSRGIHVLVRIERRWTFDQVRRAALALARDIERRVPGLATSAWWKEERHGVFVDYNQNAKDRTVASAYSVRPKPDARVSTPVTWDELPDCDPADFTLWTVPRRLAESGDPHAAIDAHADSLDALLELSARHESQGQADAPWPPHYRKGGEEPTRAAPSRRRQTPVAPRPEKPPLIEIARSAHEPEALQAIEAWKAQHPEIAAHLEPADVLLDRMRGSSSLSYRVRINLTHVPPDLRPLAGKG